MPLRRLWVLGLFLSLLAACGRRARAPMTPNPTLAPPAVTIASLPVTVTALPQTPTAGATPTALPTAPTAPSPGPTPAPTISAYTLNVRYDALNRRFIVEEAGRYVNTTGHPVDRLPLVAPAFTRAYISISRLTVEGKPASFFWDWDRWVVWVPLDSPLEPEAALNFRIAYVLTLRELRTRPEDNTRPMVLGASPLQTNGVDVFFFVAHYDDHRGWVLPRYWPFGEFITYPAADYTLYLDVPKGWEVAVSGVPVPCPEGTEGLDACYRLAAGRGIAFSTSTVYRVFTKEVPSRQGRPVRLEAYLFAGDADLGPYVLEVMENALRLFEDWFGPYHRERLVFVVGDFPFSLEYDGLFFVRRSFFFDEPQYRLTALTAHEVAHQWWYAQVGNDPALAPWMDESLASYAEALYYRTYLPEYETWWWDGGYWEGLKPAAGPIDRPLWEYRDYFKYRAAAYLKGAYFWREVHETLGDEGFRQLLHAYVGRYRGRVAPPDGLFTLLMEALGEEAWSRLRTKYFGP